MIAESTEWARKFGAIPTLSRNCGLPREGERARPGARSVDEPVLEARAVRHPAAPAGTSPELDHQEVPMKTRRLLAGVLVALALLAACGGDDDGTVGAASSTTSTSAAPKLDHIVSISPTATEILFAIGAGDQVVAGDDQSTDPTHAPETQPTNHQPHPEAIAQEEP